jgi:hypothetical protein
MTVTVMDLWILEGRVDEQREKGQIHLRPFEIV